MSRDLLTTMETILYTLLDEKNSHKQHEPHYEVLLNMVGLSALHKKRRHRDGLTNLSVIEKETNSIAKVSKFCGYPDFVQSFGLYKASMLDESVTVPFSYTIEMLEVVTLWAMHIEANQVARVDQSIDYGLLDSIWISKSEFEDLL